MKRLLANIALLFGVFVIVAPVAMTQTQNPYVLTAAKIATALGYTPANGSLYCALAGCTMSGTLTGHGIDNGSFNIISTSAGGWSGVTWGINWAVAKSFTMSGLGTIGFGATDSGQVANDTAVSRGGAATFLFGNGTQGDFSGTVKATNFNSGGTPGVDCAAGINAVTGRAVKGIITAC